MRYQNSLTTPSGTRCSLNEITNEEYLVLLKFANAEDYKGFYNYLDLLIGSTINNFESYNIIDKAYIYIAFCYFSIRQTMPIKERVTSQVFVDSEVALVVMLDNIEEKYYPRLKKIELKSGICVESCFPKKLLLDQDGIAIDFSSAVCTINGNSYTEQEISKFLSKIDTKYIVSIWEEVQKDSELPCNLIKGGANSKIEVNLCSPEIFYVIFWLYKYPLNVFYEEQYIAIQYMRLSMGDFYKMTPLEFAIMIKNFNKDKEEQKQEGKPMISPQMEDVLMP